MAWYCRLVHELVQGPSYRARMAAIDVVQHGVVRVFSTAFLKVYWWGPLLTLVGDPVASVRAQVAVMLPLLKHALMLPEDVPRLVCRPESLTTWSTPDRSRSIAAWGC